jgi:hypothetical protein
MVYQTLKEQAHDHLDRWITTLETREPIPYWVGKTGLPDAAMYYYAVDKSNPDAPVYFNPIVEDMYDGFDWDNELHTVVYGCCAMGVAGVQMVLAMPVTNQHRWNRLTTDTLDFLTAQISHWTGENLSVASIILDRLIVLNDKRGRSFPFIARWLRLVLALPKANDNDDDTIEYESRLD